MMENNCLSVSIAKEWLPTSSYACKSVVVERRGAETICNEHSSDKIFAKKRDFERHLLTVHFGG